MIEPMLPPAYRLMTLSDEEPFECALSATGIAEDGDLYWRDRPDRLEIALLLHPELPAAMSRCVAHVAMVGLGDAIGALAPPVIAVEFGWPDRLVVNGALAGGLRLATAEANGDAIPDWQVLGVTVAILGDPQDLSPGTRPDVTTLHDEGAVEIASPGLMESFARHFLAWVHRWQEDGFAPICESWLARAQGRGQAIEWQLRNGPVSGRFVGLDDEGGLLLSDGDGDSSAYCTIPLGSALAEPNWTL